jgi:hypothetical protein
LSLWITIHESTCVASGGPGTWPEWAGLTADFAALAPRPAPTSEKPTIIAPPPLRNVLRESSFVRISVIGYLPPFAITAAAFWIAVRIRG